MANVENSEVGRLKTIKIHSKWHVAKIRFFTRHSFLKKSDWNFDNQKTLIKNLLTDFYNMNIKMTSSDKTGVYTLNKNIFKPKMPVLLLKYLKADCG